MVLVSHRYRFVYLKTHKTASTSVEAALEPFCRPEGPGAPVTHRRPARVSRAGIIGARGERHIGPTVFWRNHMPAWQVALALGPARWRGYAKLAVVRNPWDRAVSLFFNDMHFTRRAWLATAPEDEIIAAFRAWLPEVRLDGNLSKLRLLGRPCIDAVIRYERLEDDIARIARRLALPQTPALPALKADRRVRDIPWPAFYDDAARARVARANRFEIAAFGYAFEAAARGRH